METTIIFSYILPAFIIVLGIYLSVKTPILKDDSKNEDKPYSLSKAQLMWWSLIIIPSISYYYGICKELHNINPSILLLLGISLGTTTLAKTIDTTEIKNGIKRHQDKNKTKNFLGNILSDGNGLSVHRFQSVIFNIIFGLIFISVFINKLEFYEFNQTELALIGISSAGYIGIKLTENNKKSKNHKPKSNKS